MKRLLLLVALVAAMATGAQAQMVGASGGTRTVTTTSNEYTPTGHYLKLEAGFPNFITVAYGYQITPWWYVGGGGGFGMITLDCYYYNSSPSVHNSHFTDLGFGFPLFAEVAFSTPKRKVSFFVDYKIGANISISDYYYHSSYNYSGDYYYRRKTGNVFYSSLNFGLGLKNFGIYAGISTNNDLYFSAGVHYKIPLKVH